MTPETREPPFSAEDDRGCPIVAAYASALSVRLDDFTPSLAGAARATLIAHAHSDEDAAKQAGISLEELAHDRVTLDATDRLPLVVVATTSQGSYYFSRPPKGWPRPGHHRYVRPRSHREGGSSI